MPVHFAIENESSLPDGGPLTYTITGKRGIDIGRDAYLDWTLPDPSRTISGKHCEIRYHDGGYWLHDVSRNGTFINRSASRVQEPYRLRDGDRIEIGKYIISVRIDEEGAPAEPESRVRAIRPPGQYWEAEPEAAPPISRRELRPTRESRPVNADFRDWAIDVPAPGASAALSPAEPRLEQFPGAAGRAMDWAQGPPVAPPPPEPLTPVPSPRRPASSPAGSADPWGDPGQGTPFGALSERGPAGLESAGGPSPWSAPDAAPRSFPPGAWDLPEQPSSLRDDQPFPSAAPPAAPSRSGGAAATAPSEWVEPVLQAPPRPAMPAMADQDDIGRPAPESRLDPPDLGRRGAPSQVRADEFLRRFAKGAGVPEDILAWQDAGDWAEELGAMVRLTAESLKQLLAARTEAKRVARASSHTTIEAFDNNPLKFSPSTEDALRTMLGKPGPGYLDMKRTLEQSFKDIKIHEVKTYSAMQHAVRLLMEGLDPALIEESFGAGGGIGGLLGSKKAKLWDVYSARWDAMTSPHEDGMVDAFLIFFAECYDRGSKG